MYSTFFIKILLSFLISVLVSGGNWGMNLPKLHIYLIIVAVFVFLQDYTDTFVCLYRGEVQDLHLKIWVVWQLSEEF